ncbi:hypothetical protein P3L10_019043 [Capsicum annuum]
MLHRCLIYKIGLKSAELVILNLMDHERILLESVRREDAQSRNLPLKRPCHKILSTTGEIILKRLMSLNCQKRKHHIVIWTRKVRDSAW